MSNMSVCVIGLGYIGLPTAAILASKGYNVSGVDIDPQVAETINKGEIHIVEPELASLVRIVVLEGRLKAYSKPRASEIYIICVPTPFHSGEDGRAEPNINYVLDAAVSISSILKAGDLVILESTCPVGTTERLSELLGELGAPISEISIAYCPERVLPGKILSELIENDRVVGGLTLQASKFAADFYRSFVIGTVFETGARTAEMCKLTENSFRDVNIAFANELSMICDKEGINVWQLIELANRHPRVNILRPGVGVGGHCIAVDPWFIVARNSETSRLIRAARSVNDSKPLWVIDKINEVIANSQFPNGIRPVITCLGVTFKPDIDDLRESPAVKIVQTLMAFGYEVLIVEPNIESHESFKIVSLKEGLDRADVLVILVNHHQFTKKLLFNFNKKNNAPILDFCGVLS